MTTQSPSLEEIMVQIRRFVEERDWTKYHKPSALAISAAIEAGELLELFQWRTDEDVQSSIAKEEYREAMADEIADVMIYLLRLCDTVGISPSSALINKMSKNARKYPVAESREKDPCRLRKAV
ncbi:MAG: nucleotide pyrophosphohydrolase [Candidatus Thorarchaeota archaeon]|nr:MAG: nucleotide pyrophosphohydrolase [Candidatus Thorarchaeota archaeon]